MAKRILVIDDDPDILEILNVILGEEGYEVKVCETGEEAERIAIIAPDLVLLDIRINGSERSGGSICFKIKSEPATHALPVIMISSEPNVDKISKLCGADWYFRKPFNTNLLLSKIKEVLAVA